MSTDMGDIEQLNKQTEFAFYQLQVSHSGFEGTYFDSLLF